MDGEGTLTKGQSEFRGTFKRNLKQNGTLKTHFGRYEGPFVNGEMHGQGKFIYNDGKVYEGEFSNGYLHGRGEIKYPNGQRARGEWIYGENKEIVNIDKN